MTDPYRLPLFFASPTPPVGSRVFVFELSAPGVPLSYVLSNHPSKNPVTRLVTLNGYVGRMFNRDASAAGAVRIVGYDDRSGEPGVLVSTLDQVEAGRLVGERLRDAR